MTENHSEFSREAAVDPSGDVGQKSARQSESVLSEVPSEKLTSCHDSCEVDLEDGDKNKNVCPIETSSNGCEEESSPLQELWVKFSTFLKKFYRTILDGKKPPDELECHINVVRELVTNDPHQVFARLEMDLQEFIIEVKLRQLELLNCVQTDEGPHLFIFCLLEGYNKLMFAAYSLSPLLMQLEAEHLKHFKITWRSLNQHLFHKLVFTEPKIQKMLSYCIAKMGKNKSDIPDFNHRLITQFLAFDAEMTAIGGRWREAESAMIKYHQENSMLDAKWRMTKVNWELIRNQTKVFHEELKSSGIPPCLDFDMVDGASPDDKDYLDILIESGRRTPSLKNPMNIKNLTDSLKKMKIDLETLQDQQLCDCCPLTAAQSPSNPEKIKSFASCLDVKMPKSCFHSSCETPSKEADILAHLNPDGKKMYSHLHKYKAHQISNVGKTHTLIFNEETSSQPDTQQSSSTSSETHKSLIRKQVIQQQRQQHQKKLLQMMQSSQQKDIQHKIQKQLQEHQLLVQQQRKIDELHAHLLQQRPTAKDAETQKNVHLQVQQRLIQKHKQVEEKFQQQVQQYMQQHQDKQTSASSPGSCSHTKRTVIGTKSTFKCSTTTSSGTTTNSAVTTASSSSSSTTTTTSNTIVSSGKTHPPSTNTKAANSTHKSSTTQTSVLTSTVNGEGWYLCPSADGKSTSYVCPKHSGDGSTYDLEISPDNSSDDEFDWENSNSPQRHCDCCYCEVFGSAPVSRNFQETRERLRLILTKKKAKSNAANNDKSNDQNVVNGSSCSNSQSASQGESKTKKDGVTGDGKTKPPEYKGDRPLQEILDFIEGNKNMTKRTAKKMRRKQRQQEEEERRRREEEEAERLRQEELRRQREEEKRRQEEERKKQELLRKQDRKKNKKQQQQQQQQSSVTKVSAASTSQNSNNKKGNNKNQIVSDNAKLAQTKKNGQKTVMDKTALQKQVAQQQQQAKSVNQGAKKKQEQTAQQVKVSQQQSKNSKSQKQTSAVQGVNNTQKKVPPPSKTGQQKNDEKTDDDSGQPQMVTIKRVMQPDSSEPTVTITLRGPTPKEDKVLYTLHNGQMSPLKDDKQKQSNSSYTSANVSNKKKVAAKTNVDATNSASNLRPSPNVSYRSAPMTNAAPTAPPPPIVTLTNGMFSKTCSVASNGVNSITERMEKMKFGPQPVPMDASIKKFASAPPPASQPELTTPTAIQINQAVSQLSSRPTFPNNFDLENIRLPPGITITKVDPATVQRRPIQVKQAPPPPPPPPPHLRPPPMMSPMAPITSMTSIPCSPNVIVVDTGDRHDEQGGNCKKKRRRRKKENGEMGQDMASYANGPAIPPYVPTNGLSGLPPRLNPMGSGMFAANGFANAAFAPQQQPAAIIQMNGSMVTIRNPALHPTYAGGQPMNANIPVAQKAEMWNSNTNDTVFSLPPEEVENGDVDEYERELEAFKRFCSQSVPAESKAKVNLNIEDIVLKKKGPSVIGCS